MSWARFDDNFPRHPKTIGLSDRAFRAFVTGVCYSAGLLTDGHLSSAVIASFASKKVRAELVAAGFWDERADGNGVNVHDFTDYNRSRVEVEEQRRKTAERVKNWRERNADSNDVTDDVGNGVTDVARNDVSNAAPDPTQPDPSRGSQKSSNYNPANNGSKTGSGEQLDYGIAVELHKILRYLNDADDETVAKFERVAKDLPEAAIISVRESVEERGGRVGTGYVINALKNQKQQQAAGGVEADDIPF
jgi:hypothetical protein